MPYQPPSQRHSHRPSKGAVIFCFILLLIIAFIAFVIYESKQPEPLPPKVSVSKPVAPPKQDLSYQARNELRQLDARALTYAGGDFYRHNNLVYPSAFAAGKVTGGSNADLKPESLVLKYYKDVSFAEGEQKPMAKDLIRFVYNAACAPSGSATVASSQSYAYVVQTALESADGTFTPQCLKL